jgi:hypothetical protein
MASVDSDARQSIPLEIACLVDSDARQSIPLEIACLAIVSLATR